MDKENVSQPEGEISYDDIVNHLRWDEVHDQLKSEGYSTGSEEEYDKLYNECKKRIKLIIMEERTQPAPTHSGESEQDGFSPPDHGDICWTTGSQTFTRKEVWYLLWTQRAMISNDLKSYCGDDLTDEMNQILTNPRKPIY